jgi:hypothetical protein
VVFVRDRVRVECTALGIVGGHNKRFLVVVGNCTYFHRKRGALLVRAKEEWPKFAGTSSPDAIPL